MRRSNEAYELWKTRRPLWRGFCWGVLFRGRLTLAIFVYNRSAKQIAWIDIPERPIDIVFGSIGHRTLLILAHHALFADEGAWFEILLDVLLNSTTTQSVAPVFNTDEDIFCHR